MRPSFSPRRVTVDGKAQRFDGDALPPRRSFGTPTPSLAAAMHPPSKQQLYAQGVLQAITCGVIIAIVLCPCMIGFSTIIYSYPEFEPLMPMLMKLIFVSSVVHQLVINWLSPLSYAIGQVQDAGLIFLSSIAASVMTELGPHVPMDERIATVLFTLSISTAFVGVGLIVLGKLRLASLVQYLPTPVIGGYLAYIGFFMVKGGVSLMTGLHLTGIVSWVDVLELHALALAAPGVICGVLLSFITSRYRHFAVFPCCLVMMPVVFFLLLPVFGSTVDDARSAGFLATEGPSISLSRIYGLFDVFKVHWRVIPSQVPTMMSMFLVISFASSLDIAAIRMGTESTMDYNEQLQTVGASNLVSGLTGGYTGSYIFSQTMFSFRFYPNEVEERCPGFSRLIGLTLAVCELGIALLPHSLMAIVPKFLFGSVMIFIGVELLKTWLFGVFAKLLLAEYVTVVCTFVFLNAFGVQVGLGCGVALAAFCFLVEYSKSQMIRVVHKSSNVIRNADQHALLYAHSNNQDSLLRRHPIVTIELQGHVFFGSATRIQNCVKRVVYVSSSQTPVESPKTFSRHDEYLPLLSSQESRVHPSHPVLKNLEGEVCTDENRTATRFVVFDFSQVTGMDATAARSCFLALKLLFRQQGITVVYCGMQEDVEFLLRANDVISTESPVEDDHHVTADLDLALDWCEQQLILSAARRKSAERGGSFTSDPLDTQALSLTKVFSAYLPDKWKSQTSVSAQLGDLADYFEVRNWSEDDDIFNIDDESDTLYVLLAGHVSLFTTPSTVSMIESSTGSFRQKSSALLGDRELVGRVRAGCIFGDLDYVLEQGRVIDARSTSPNTITASITRVQVERLRQERVDLACLLQEILLRASYMTIAEKLHLIVV
ncbi:TPA: hypothetical protein N0F65_007664 [Lagenidium giganteum]|uniref:STAS domain-containing protein n=1 Tax=Lagenidium giganteum TaxID=4803 RepID=A0AAV2Z9Q6_9STRA|nr:TPA: hypothetical protein N0F65_007664 [Lagenidium giganteum]